MKTLHMTTLGCDKNTIDSEMMLGLIEEKNYDIIDDPQAAEIIIVKNFMSYSLQLKNNLFLAIKALQR